MIGIFLLLTVTAWAMTPLSFHPRARPDDVPRQEVATKRRQSRPLVPVDHAIIADLVRSALIGGSSIPSALLALDEALNDDDTHPVARAARILLLGGEWEEAWQNVPPRFFSLYAALEPAWQDGAAPLPLLERSAASTRQRRAREAREAAAKLGEKVVLPLGLCFLPAFVAVGIVPVIVAAGVQLF